MRRWLLKGVLLGLPLFIFCTEVKEGKRVEPFVLPPLELEAGGIAHHKAVAVEDMDAFIKAVADENIKTRAYRLLEFDSGLYERGSSPFD